MNVSNAKSKQLQRVLRVRAEAVKLFGSATAASEWMDTPARFITGKPTIAPAELARSEPGARLLENRIRRTAYGML